MKPMPPTRGMLWSAIVAVAVVALIAASFLFRRSATARTPERATADSAGEGVVCFGTVDLENGVTSLFPLQPGRVAEVLVHENQAVSQGAELVRLEDGVARSRLSEAEAAWNLSRLDLREARKLPEQQRRRIDEQKGVLEAMQSRLAAARRILAERPRESQPAFVAAVDVFAGEIQVRELEALERVEIQRLAELQGRDVDAEIRRAEYQVAVAQARRDQARLALDECRVKSPRPGTVLRILVGPGDVLGSERGAPALLFAADGPQVIRATVEQEFAHLIKKGDAAVIQDDTSAGLSLRGRVERVAGWYSQRRTVLHDPTQMSDVRTLECLIILDPGQPRMRLGQAVRVFLGTEPPR